MKKNIILGLFTLALMTSSALAVPIETVLVTTNTLIIPYSGTYSVKQKVMLGTNSLPWSQAGKSANIIATLPNGIATGTYRLQLTGKEDVSVAIGSVNAEAGLSDSISAEVTRATTAEDGLSNSISAENSRATGAEADLSDSISTEATRAITAETGLSNSISAETSRATTAEAVLSVNISTEVTRAITAEAGLSNSISAETSRATGAEAGLSNSIVTTFNSTSNSIVASLTKDLSILTIASSGSVTNNHNTFISFTTFTNGTVSTVGDTNGWSADGTLYTVPTTGIYEVGFSFNVSSAPDSINEIIIDQNFVTYKVYSFPAVTSGYSTWAGQTTIQCNAGDTIGFVPYTSSGDSVVCGPEPLIGIFGPANVMEVSIKQIQ